ncbi:MAG: hypothetical protein JXA92_06570 [candidate division Zixibacteria bacterium]|nr:hypothetical protein [candidate division Zixibacteria bacterium]
MYKKISLPVILLALFFTYTCDQGTKKVVLRYKHKAGYEMIYATTVKSNLKVLEADTVTKEHSSVTEYRIDNVVKRVLEDSTFEVYSTSTRSSEVITTKDSTIQNGEKKAWERIVYFKPNGKTIDVEFPEPIDSAWADYIRESYKQGLPVFPDGEVFVGYSWTQTTKVLIDDESSLSSTTYKVKSFAREKGYDCVVIEYEGNMVIPIKPYTVEKAKGIREGIDRMDMKGVMYFAYKEGVAVSFRENWKMNGDRKVTKETGEVTGFNVIVEGDYTETLIDRKKS